MKSAQNISGEQVINRDPVTATTDESLSQLRNKLEENRLKAVPVVDDRNRLQGAVGYRDLIRFIQFNPESTGLEKVMHQPPEFDVEDSMVELCDLRINSGRKMLVNTSGEKLDGVIGEQEMLDALTELEDMEKFSTKDVATREVIKVFEEDSVEEARHAMLDNNISRLPVLNSEGKLTGVVDSIDILRMLVPRESMKSGGTQGGRKASEVKMAGGGEKERLSGVTVDEIMDRNVSISEAHMDAIEAVELMQERGRDELFFVDGEYPEGVVTLKDFVKEIAGRGEKDTVLVSLTGLDLPEEKAAVHEKIEKQLRGSLGRKLQKPEEVSLRIKKSEKDGKKHRWELDLKLYSEFGVTSVNTEDWELLDAVDEALGELNEVIRRKHEKRSEHRR
ncbi:MAG: HPP family protein [Candidatus Nanohaloarchaea archaeon]